MPIRTLGRRSKDHQQQQQQQQQDDVRADDNEVDLADGISFQLRYLGSTRIFRHKDYHFWFDVPFAVFFVLMYSTMFVLHTMTLIFCSSLTEFTDLMYVFGIQINELVKMYDIISHNQRIRTMLNGLHSSVMFPAARSWSYPDQLRAAQRHVRRSSLLLYVAAGSSAAMVLISALFKHHTLPFASWFPMSIDTDLKYWLAYAQEMGYVFYLSPINITLDTFLTGLMHFVAVKLDILRVELEHLGRQCSPNGEFRSARLPCTELMRNMRRVIVFHQDIVFMIKEIEEIFNRGIFVQCITCGSTLCIVGYRILIAKPFSNDFIAMVLILTAFLGEIFYYCHYGNQIQVKAHELSNALYTCPWYEFDCGCAPPLRQRHRRALLSSVTIIMERTKRPTYVTAGKLVKLTYETFISICKGGFQAFAVLRDMQAK